MPPSQEPSSRDFYQPALELPHAVRGALGALAEPLSRLVVPLAYALGLALAVGGAFPLGYLFTAELAVALHLIVEGL